LWTALKVKEIMSRDPIVISEVTSIVQIRKIFRSHKIWSILVGDSQKYVGIITRKDLKYRSKNKKSSTPAAEIMSTDIYTIDQEDDVIKAISTILEKNINGLAVTNNGLPCGIITRYDIRERYNRSIFNYTPSQKDYKIKHKNKEKFSQDRENQKPEKYDSIYTHQFRIALSFSGTFRNRVAEIAQGLISKLGENTIFYDFLYTGHLAQADLDLLLQKIYKENCELIVVFLSKDYGEKEWCKIEYRVIRELMNTGNSDKIMFLKFETCEIPGLFQQDGYLDIQHMDSSTVVEKIIQRFQGIPVSATNLGVEASITESNPFIQESMKDSVISEEKKRMKKMRHDLTRSITDITLDTMRLR